MAVRVRLEASREIKERRTKMSDNDKKKVKEFAEKLQKLDAPGRAIAEAVVTALSMRQDIEKEKKNED